MNGYRWYKAIEGSSMNSACLINHTRYFLSASMAGVTLHNHETQDQVILPNTPPPPIQAVHATNDGKYCAIASLDFLLLYDIVRQSPVHKVYSHNREPGKRTNYQILDCKYINQDLLASCGVDHRLCVYDRRTTTFNAVFTVDVGDDKLHSLDYNKNPTNAITVGSADGSLYSLDLRMQQLITDTFSSHDSSVSNVARSGQDLSVVTYQDGTIKCFDSQSGISLTEFDTSDRPQLQHRLNAEFIESSSAVINGTEEGTVQIWNVDQTSHRAKKARELKANIPKQTFKVVRYDEQTNRIIAASTRASIHIWDDVF